MPRSEFQSAPHCISAANLTTLPENVQFANVSIRAALNQRGEPDELGVMLADVMQFQSAPH